MVKRVGTDSANELVGTIYADDLDGRGGNDLLRGLAGNDALRGGNGYDRLRGGSGNDFLDGQIGNDTLAGESGSDRLHGGYGGDTLYGGSGDDYLDGGPAGDALFGGSGHDAMYGGTGNDTLRGELGNDVLDGGSGENYLFGGEGDDTFGFAQGYAEIHGEEGSDTLTFASAGAAASITLFGDFADFFLEDGGWGSFDGIETVIGTSFADSVFSEGTAEILGGAGDDSLSGYGTLSGEDGNDVLQPADHTSVQGGSGADTFVINYNFGSLGFLNADQSVIQDFQHGEDVIQLQGEDPALLTHLNDVWTVTYFDSDLQEQNEVSFWVAGITELQAGVDYFWV
jgi:Ca2+-binding RTX toxin-like protein